MRSSACVVLVSILACTIYASAGGANLSVAHIFGSNMVFQQGTSPCIWGFASSGTTVTVASDVWNGSGVTGDDLKWKVCADQAVVSKEPFQLTISASATEVITLENVVIGDVYVCSGQSNMQFSVSQSFGGAEEIPMTHYPNLRLFTVANLISDTPEFDMTSFNDMGWNEATPESVGGPDWNYFSAVCYYYGKELMERDANTPVGLVASDWGGTYIQAWSSPTALAKCPSALSHDTHLLDAASSAAVASFADIGDGPNPNQPSVLWNAMINPILNYPIKGALWYQGESNSGDVQYGCRFKAMINDWRENWRASEDFPFLFVQIAPFPQGGNMYAALRASQTEALALKNVGMAVTIDIGDADGGKFGSIHPRNKRTVSERLAIAADAVVFKKDVVFEGPRVASMSVNGQQGSLWTVDVTFDPKTSVGEMIITGSAQCTECCSQLPFVAHGSLGTWTRVTGVTFPEPSTARVVFTLAQGETPIDLLYAWEDYPQCVIIDATSTLPMEPFAAKLPVQARLNHA